MIPEESRAPLCQPARSIDKSPYLEGCRVTPGSRMPGGSQDFELRETGPIGRSITREQRQPLDDRVRSNVKVRKWGSLLSTPPVTAQEGLAGEGAGFPWQSFPLPGSQRQRGIQSFNRAQTDRHLGVNNGVDNQGRTVGTLSQRTSRPVRPLQAVGGYVQKNVAVDEDAAATAQTVCQIVERRRHFPFAPVRLPPRVSAMISFVDMPLSAAPRSALRAFCPRTLGPSARLALRIRAWWPLTSNSTSVWGNRPIGS